MSAQRIFVIGEDTAARESALQAAAALGLAAQLFSEPEDFLSCYGGGIGCVIADLGEANVASWKSAFAQNGRIPLILLADPMPVDDIVRAVKGGAFTVLAKPCPADRLAASISDALAAYSAERERTAELAAIEQRLAGLDAKEHAVLELLLVGKSNKAMASQLGTSTRTIENRRRSIFQKLNVRSVAELVTLVLKVRGV